MSSRTRSVTSRREFLAASGLVALGLVGCSRPAGSTSSAPDTVDFAYGDIRTRVPLDPQRVVVLEGRGDLEFALLAGWPLAGVRNVVDPLRRPGGQYEGLLEESVPLLSSGAERPDVEEIAALQPDLIVLRANSWRLDSYGNQLLAGVAPLLPVEVNRPAFREDMTAQLSQVGVEAAGRPWLEEYDAVVTAGRSAIAASGAPGSVALMSTQMAGTGSVRWWTNRLATTVAHDLGLDVLGFDPADEEGEIELSLEEVGQVAAAGAIFHQSTADDPVAAAPTWQALPAVRAGMSHVLDPALNNGLAITATSLAERMTTALTGA